MASIHRSGGAEYAKTILDALGIQYRENRFGIAFDDSEILRAFPDASEPYWNRPVRGQWKNHGIGKVRRAGSFQLGERVYIHLDMELEKERIKEKRDGINARISLARSRMGDTLPREVGE